MALCSVIFKNSILLSVCEGTIVTRERQKKGMIHPNRYSFMNCPLPPGRPARGRRPGVGTHPATGRPGVGPGSGLRLGSPWPRYDIHYESPGVPDPPPYQGFREA